ncbi:hypothetical protein QBC47DRAFT_404315 [Echria macrotheca]|uniref:Uncharacterized protein n=1 Tax=Echria macrotheca TaxID=438768 RepID=A0AAJ0F726_9PEZI|nr:hypothetical protein QBC47DRAFT_404315 [Echria macrotheca]
MDIAHDLQLSDEQLNMATVIAAPFFADPIADSLRSPNSPKAPGDFSDWEPTALVKYLWDQFSTIHGGTLDTWPNVLHCQEFVPQLNMLRSYTRQLWRTVWFGAGVNALNNSHEVTYAISFKFTAPVPPKVSSGKEEKSRCK